MEWVYIIFFVLVFIGTGVWLGYQIYVFYMGPSNGYRRYRDEARMNGKQVLIALALFVFSPLYPLMLVGLIIWGIRKLFKDLKESLDSTE